MPLLPSTYNPPLLFKNTHFATIYAAVFRKVALVQQRERLQLNDGDFLDIDWSYATEKTSKLIILLHGLEGNAGRPYVKGSAAIFNANGFDACAVNFRSCSGENNKQYRTYNSGETRDLEATLAHIQQLNTYETIVIKGFSLGGNVALKYAGSSVNMPAEVKAVIGVSVPCFLYGSMLQLHRLNNRIYHNRFKKDLVGKLKQKRLSHPNRITHEDVAAVKTLRDFDEVYTARAFQFKNALEYYEKSSALPYLSSIKIPALLLNAANDSFLSKECYPMEIAKTNPNFYLEIPEYGGHVGFYLPGLYYYNELKAIDFMKKIMLL